MSVKAALPDLAHLVLAIHGVLSMGRLLNTTGGAPDLDYR